MDKFDFDLGESELTDLKSKTKVSHFLLFIS
jgi:hypothetical protein